MRQARVVRLLLALVLALVPAAVVAVEAPGPPDHGELAQVVHVTDGDTIRVRLADGREERVRYIGIDTPEVGHEPGEPDEPWGPEATDANRALVEGEVVLLERDTSDTDRYDRLLRYVWVEGDTGWLMVNGELVARGLAEVRAYEPDTRNHDWFRQLQEEARAAGRGMYGDEPDEDGSLFDDLLDFLFGG